MPFIEIAIHAAREPGLPRLRDWVVRHTMLADIRVLFCKWTTWELKVLTSLSDALAERHRPVLKAQIDAITKVQRIAGWREIDFYVVRKGRVCWTGIPDLGDQSEFRLARARTEVAGVTIQSELCCIQGHLFSIESDVLVKPHAFRPDAKVEIRDVDSRYA